MYLIIQTVTKSVSNPYHYGANNRFIEPEFIKEEVTINRFIDSDEELMSYIDPLPNGVSARFFRVEEIHPRLEKTTKLVFQQGG